MAGRVDTIEDLQAYLRGLFGPDIDPAPINGYQVMFTMPGKVKPMVAAAQQQTGVDGWDGEAGNWFFKSTADNVNMLLRAAHRSVLVVSSIVSLHEAALAEHTAAIMEG